MAVHIIDRLVIMIYNVTLPYLLDILILFKYLLSGHRVLPE